jgi:hypothetical protein
MIRLPNGWTATEYPHYGELRYKVRDANGILRDDVNSLDTAWTIATRNKAAGR